LNSTEIAKNIKYSQFGVDGIEGCLHHCTQKLESLIYITVES
jgi:hypothetical protein